MCQNVLTNVRRGLTLAELLVAGTVTVMMAGTVAALATTVQTSNDAQQRSELMTQHGRVAIERIERAMNGATGNEQFPGIVAFSTTVGSFSFPDTAIVWKPANATPLNPTGLPIYAELTIFCPSATTPNVLVEITRPADATTTPKLTNAAGWATLLATFKSNTDGNSVIKPLTDLLRTSDPGNGQKRGNIRFDLLLRPSDDATANAGLGWYRNPSTAKTYDNWRSLWWPLDQYTKTTGVRQTWCRIELQLMPGADAAASDPTGKTAVPFLGSAACYHDVSKDYYDTNPTP